MNGCNISCIANYDEARIDLFICKPDSSTNKKIFDFLYGHKSEIENTLGVQLLWDRGDGKKSSKICYRIEKISIEDENDWAQMARFHAEWSKKFNDVIVPNMKETKL